MTTRIVTTIFPFPTNTGGKRRIVTILNAFLRAGQKVELLVIAKKNERIDYSELPEGLDLVIFRQSNLTYLINILRSIWRFEPMQVSIYRDGRVSRLIKNRPVETTVLHLIRCSWLRPAGNVILEMTDSLALNYSRRVADLSKWLQNPLITSIYFLEFLLVRKYERKICEKFFRSILVSSVDAEYIYGKKKLQALNVAVIPLAIDDVSEKTKAELLVKNGIFFIGRLDYEPNEAAIRYFLDQCFLRVLEKLPGIVLCIVGGGANQSLKTRFKDFGDAIEHTDYVEDLRQITSRSFCSIAPMQSGAGMQNKILDAMNHSLPVVTTRLGFGDLKFNVGEEIFIAESDEDFVALVVRLYENPFEAMKFGDNARLAVRGAFGFEKFAGSYLKECFDEQIGCGG